MLFPFAWPVYITLRFFVCLLSSEHFIWKKKINLKWKLILSVLIRTRYEHSKRTRYEHKYMCVVFYCHFVNLLMMMAHFNALPFSDPLVQWLSIFWATAVDSKFMMSANAYIWICAFSVSHHRKERKKIQTKQSSRRQTNKIEYNLPVECTKFINIFFLLVLLLLPICIKMNGYNKSLLFEHNALNKIEEEKRVRDGRHNRPRMYWNGKHPLCLCLYACNFDVMPFAVWVVCQSLRVGRNAGSLQLLIQRACV